MLKGVSQIGIDQSGKREIVLINSLHLVGLKEMFEGYCSTIIVRLKWSSRYLKGALISDELINFCMLKIAL